MAKGRDEIEHRVLAEHVALRGLVVRVENVAGQITRDERRLLGALRTETRALYDALQAHVAWENEALLPRLRGAGTLGAQRAAYLEHDHSTQLRLFARCLESLEAQDVAPTALAREILDLAAQLRDDLADEEDMVADDKLVGRRGAAPAVEASK